MEEYLYPSPKFIGQANCTDPSIYDTFSLSNFPKCFDNMAKLLSWYKYWHTTFDSSKAPFWRWFVEGELNACYNCVDRHFKSFNNKIAIYFVPEPEEEEIVSITYQQLYNRVNEVAVILQEFADKKGDRVTLHLPMTPELIITMLTCARIGAIHSQVFAGYSGRVCGDRIWDSDSDVLITMDCYYRNGTLIDHKKSR